MTTLTRTAGNWYQRLADSPAVFDACIPQVLWEIRRRRNQGEKRILQDVLYPLMRKGGLAAGIATVFAPIRRLQTFSLLDSLRNLGIILEDLESSADAFRLVETAGDFDHAAQQNQVALLLGFQGLPPLDQELYYFGMLKRMGVRIVQATYNEKCEVGDGCAERGNGGLSNFGVKVIQELNRRRMVVDLSHVGERTFYDVLELSTAPVVASHSNAGALCNHFRCLTDSQFKAIAAKEGVVGINAFARHVASEPAGLKHFLGHVEYVAKLIGVEHVGIGLDLVYYTAPVEQYPDPYIPSGDQIEGLTSVTDIPEIAEGLATRGFSEAEILGVLGGNFLRVIRSIVDP